MRRSRWLVLCLWTAACCTLPIDHARAEGFVALYGGTSSTSDATRTVTANGSLFASGKEGFDDAVSVGGRVGYWLESVPWLGFALDVSRFDPDEDSTAGFPPLELDVVPISALLMLRTRLLWNNDFPRGRLQPYAGIGPGVFVSDADLSVPDFSDKQVDVGLDVRAGLNFHPLKSWQSFAIFAEYRYTSFEPRFDDTSGGVKTEIKTDLDSHHLVAGIAFHF